MAFSIQYKPLFQVNILHNYFLNKGDEEFLTMKESDKNRQLDVYDVNTFFSVVPTGNTARKLSGHNLVFKTTNTGFTVWSKVTGNNNNIPFIEFDDDLYFTFLLKLKDTAFLNYSYLMMENAGKLYYFSNRKPVGEPNSFRLINQSGNNHHINKNFVLNDTSIETELEKLDTSEKENLFGIIRIFIKADKPAMHVTNVHGRIKSPFKIFELLFDNRRTIWRFIYDEDKTVDEADDVKKEGADSKIFISKTEHPLTQKGFIYLKQGGINLPNPNARLIKPDTSSSKYYSEIYM
jgi:hypothetical protein